MNKLAKFSLLGALALGLGTVAAIPQAQAATRLSVSVGFAPPPARYERVPAARVGFVWSRGYWGWTGVRYQWRPGRWHRARAGYAYHRPTWVHDGGRWTYRHAGWHRDYRHGYRHGARRVAYYRDHDRRYGRHEGRYEYRHDGRAEHRAHERHERRRDRRYGD